MDEAVTDPSVFETRFRRALRRLRWRSAVHATASALPWLQAAWLAAFLIQRLGYPLLPQAWTLTALAALLLVQLGLRLRRAPAGRSAALVLDRCLGTRELVTAAHEEAASEEPRVTSHPFARLARQRAAAALTPDRVTAALPMTPWRGWRPAMLGWVAIVLAPFLPLRQPGVEATEVIDPVVEQTAQTLAEELAPLVAETAAMERPQAEEALERLQELVDEMRQGELPTVDEALVALTRFEETLRELTRDTAASGFDALVQDLAAEPLAADLAQAMSAADREALRESLQRMGEALTGPEARSEAMQRQIERLQLRLMELADLLAADGEAELADALRELADALAAGKLDEARELLESSEIAGACQAGGDRAGSERLGNQLAELMQLGRFLLGQDPQTLSRTGSPVPSLSSSPSGPYPGTATTHLEESGYTAGDPILRDRRSPETAGWQEDFAALYESRLSRGEGEALHIEGEVGGAGEMLSQTGRGLGVTGEGSLPLRPFGEAAAGAAERATDMESVPLGYRHLVRRYFERNPERSTAAGEASQGGEN